MPKFEITVNEGYQFTEKGFTRTKLLLSVTDGKMVGWYVFAEGLIPYVDEKFFFGWYVVQPSAEKTVKFGDGAIDRGTIQTRHPMTFDGFASGPSTTRIHDARFVPIKGAKEPVRRLELSMSFDLGAGTTRETVLAMMSLLSLERPDHNIHPAVGRLILLGRQTFAESQLGLSPAETKAVRSHY